MDIEDFDAVVAVNLRGAYLCAREVVRHFLEEEKPGVIVNVSSVLAGGACCAPAVILILGLQLSSVLVTAFQILIPLSTALLLVTLKLILDRIHPELVAA